MRKILFGILLSVLMVFSSVADDITCGPGTEPYTELEYIESTGAQWIDTGVVPLYTDTIDITFMSGNIVFGVRNITGGAGGAFFACTSNTPGFTGFLDWFGDRWNFNGVNKNSMYRLLIQNRRATLFQNGLSVMSHTYSGTKSVQKSLPLFALKDGGENVQSASGTRIYSFAMIRNGNYILDFVPARRDGAVGMYDRVGHKFYGNDGTGEFVAGPDVGLLLGSSCNVCGDGYYNNTGNNTLCVQCPAGYNAAGDNASDHDNINDCKITCSPGYYVATPNARCVGVGNGYYYSSNQNINYGSVGIRNQCPDGLTTIGFGTGADEVGDCGRKLHVGDDVIYLRSVKKTTPSLNIQYGDRILYGNMDSYTIPMNINTTRKLHIEYNDIVYSVHDDSTDFVGMGYLFSSDGRLVGASDNIYIESTGTQYIDTGVLTHSNITLEADVSNIVSNITVGLNTFITGSNNKQNQRITLPYLASISGKRNWSYGYGSINEELPIPFNTNTRYYLKTVNNVGLQEVYINNILVYKNNDYSNFNNNYVLFIFAQTFNGAREAENLTSFRLHRWKATDADGTLVRDFVPVPKGMVINGYTVPANGMWDIVEQKFYGNSGTGEFIYGMD